MMKHFDVWEAIRDLWRKAPDWDDAAESRVSAALDAAVAAECERCAKVVMEAREGERDGDFRSLIYAIRNP